MNGLSRLAGADRNNLREMELKAGRMAEHLGDGAEHDRMHDELAGFWRARDQSAGPAGAAAAEIVGAERSVLGKGTQLARDLVHHFGADDIVNDDASVVGERRADFVGRSRRRQVFDHIFFQYSGRTPFSQQSSNY